MQHDLQLPMHRRTCTTVLEVSVLVKPFDIDPKRSASENLVRSLKDLGFAYPPSDMFKQAQTPPGALGSPQKSTKAKAGNKQLAFSYSNDDSMHD